MYNWDLQVLQVQHSSTSHTEEIVVFLANFVIRNKFDIALSGIARTETRKAMADFSKPYYFGNKVGVIRKNDA